MSSMAPVPDPLPDRNASRRTPWALLVVALLVLVAGIVVLFVGRWPLSTGQVIDGFPVGMATSSCGGSGGVGDGADTWSCEAWHRMASEVLDHREPGHPEIVRYSVHGQDEWNPAFFPDGPPSYGAGPFMVMVMRLSDGSVRAVGIGCNPGGCGATDDPPMKPGETPTLCHPDRTRWNQCDEVISVARAELDATEPDHPEIIDGTQLDAEDDDGHYSVQFNSTDGMLPAIAVDCTPDGCRARRSDP